MFLAMSDEKVVIKSTYPFQDQGAVYLFSNENISGYLNQIGNLDGGRVLTVGASGDHAFEAYARGAARVDTFDINSAQRCVIELKNHMIRNLSYSDFMDFFFEKATFFSPDIIKPIQKNFSDGLKDFLMQYYCERGYSMFKYLGAQTGQYEMKNLSYLANQDAYQKLAAKLPESIDFKHCGIDGVSYAFQQRARYDLIMLSNIFEYLYTDKGFMQQELKIQQFYDEIMAGMADKILANNGQICFSYIWGVNPNAWANFLRYFEGRFVPATDKYRHVFRSLGFDSSHYGCDHDAVLVMKQRQR